MRFFRVRPPAFKLWVLCHGTSPVLPWRLRFYHGGPRQSRVGPPGVEPGTRRLRVCRSAAGLNRPQLGRGLFSISNSAFTASSASHNFSTSGPPAGRHFPPERFWRAEYFARSASVSIPMSGIFGAPFQVVMDFPLRFSAAEAKAAGFRQCGQIRKNRSCWYGCLVTGAISGR